MRRKKITLLIVSHPQSGYSMVKSSRLINSCFQSFPINFKTIKPSDKLSAHLKKMSIKKFTRYIEIFIFFPFKIFQTKILYDVEDVFLVDHSDAFFLFLFKKNLATVLVHDQFAYLAASSKIPNVRIRFTGKCLQKIIHYGLKRSKEILAVSQATKKILKEIGFTQNITTIYLTWLPWDREDNIQQLASDNVHNYALLVSPSSWRKNRVLAISCIIEFRKCKNFENLELIIIGNRLTENELNEINLKELDFIHTIESVSHQNLRKYYTNSLFCIATSNYEGLGLPILEANSFGKICVHNQLPSFMEITNDFNIVLKSPLENNDWESFASQIQNSNHSMDLARITEETYGFNVFRENLRNKLFTSN